MTDLDAVLEAARNANPNERIDLRDPIARHGDRAVAAMRDWLQDARLGVFAVRVLEAIARDHPTSRSIVLDVLRSAADTDPETLATREASEAFRRLGGKEEKRVGRARRAVADPWPGTRAVSPVEMRFHEAMLEIYHLAGEATRRPRSDGTVARGYWPTYFLRAVRNHGGPAYARQLLHKEGTSDGFRRLAEEGRLDITAEALILKPEFADLFSSEERAIAARRLGAGELARRETK